MTVYAWRYECPKCKEAKTIFTDIKDLRVPLAVKCVKPGCDGVAVKKDWDPEEPLPNATKS